MQWKLIYFDDYNTNNNKKQSVVHKYVKFIF